MVVEFLVSPVLASIIAPFQQHTMLSAEQLAAEVRAHLLLTCAKPHTRTHTHAATCMRTRARSIAPSTERSSITWT